MNCTNPVSMGRGNLDHYDHYPGIDGRQLGQEFEDEMMATLSGYEGEHGDGAKHMAFLDETMKKSMWGTFQTPSMPAIRSELWAKGNRLKRSGPENVWVQQMPSTRIGSLDRWIPRLTRLQPVPTCDDGDSMLHALLLGILGIHDHHGILREMLRSAMKMEESKQVFCDKLGAHLGTRTDGASGQHPPTEEQVARAFKLSVAAAMMRGLSLEPLNIYVLANVLKRPVVVYPSRPENMDYAIENNAWALHGVYLPTLSSPDTCHKVPLLVGATLSFSPTPLSPTENKATMSYRFTALVPENELQLIPLVDIEGNSLIVRFENGDDALRQYMEVEVVRTLGGSAVLAASMQGGQLNHWGQCVLRGMKGETQARSYGAQRQRRNEMRVKPRRARLWCQFSAAVGIAGAKEGSGKPTFPGVGSVEPAGPGEEAEAASIQSPGPVVGNAESTDPGKEAVNTQPVIPEVGRVEPAGPGAEAVSTQPVGLEVPWMALPVDVPPPSEALSATSQVPVMDVEREERRVRMEGEEEERSWCARVFGFLFKWPKAPREDNSGSVGDSTRARCCAKRRREDAGEEAEGNNELSQTDGSDDDEGQRRGIPRRRTGMLGWLWYREDLPNTMGGSVPSRRGMKRQREGMKGEDVGDGGEIYANEAGSEDEGRHVQGVRRQGRKKWFWMR